MSKKPVVWVETIGNPSRYHPMQIEAAVKIAFALDRGRFVLTEPPRR